ncbi:MAG: energy-coupling factor transporter transmembrane component T [Clostridiaceae bacterium]|nr:energy-coupling factor transporter transmembrane component T [Clostridiaceae bacterium]
MLKDITLGQYFPGNSPIHRMDPRTKLLALILYIVTIFIADGLIPYVICAAGLAAVIRVSRIPLKLIMKALKPIVIIIIFTGALNILYTPGTELFRLWIFRVTVEGIRTAITMIVRILLLVASTSLLTYTTSPMALTDGLESLLGPLKKFHVPVHEFSMMMSIALRFIPTLIEETDKIMSAQKARGADFESGNIFQRAKALVPVLVPLFISAFRRADELACAMECRLYHGGEHRTRLHSLRYGKVDAWGGLAAALVCGGVIALSFVL